MGEKSVKFKCPNCGEWFEIVTLNAENLSDKETAMDIKITGRLKQLEQLGAGAKGVR